MFVLYYVLLSQVVIIFGQDTNLKQQSVADPFELSCSDGSYISSISSVYTDKIDDHRRYEIKCAKFNAEPDGITCRLLPETNYTSSFSSSCSKNEFVSGLDSTEFKDQDRKFRVSCCTMNDVTVLDDTCHETITSAMAGFTMTVLSGQIIKKISSQYLLGKHEGKFIPDRSFGFTLCNFTESSSKSSGDSFDSPQNDNAANSANAANAARSIASFNQKKNSITKSDSKNDDDGSFFETVAFQPFDIKCPKGQGIKSINVKKVDQNSLSDAVIGLKCGPLPNNVDTSDTEDQILGYIAQTDGSVQSPCAPANGQFLCGLKGIYDQNRQVEAHCCRISNTIPSLNQRAQTVIPSTNGSVLKSDSTKEEYIGNLDQLSDGTFVAQMIVFGKTYTIKGTNILTAEGCRCKCACECPKNRLRRKRLTKTDENFSVLVQSSKHGGERMKRQNNCTGDCVCKCSIPDC